ncbi:hypothetical protein FACS1894105_12010 [Clostridia bacterium]|nr:hypothetical protein FACS1894105_12010 [Clostridia bacterium]
MIKDNSTTIGYYCPACGRGYLQFFNVFSMDNQILKLKCECGKSTLDLQITRDRKMRLNVPCIICPSSHSFTISIDAFFSKDIYSFTCKYTAISICFIGQQDKVEEAMLKNEDELYKMFAEFEQDANLTGDGIPPDDDEFDDYENDDLYTDDPLSDFKKRYAKASDSDKYNDDDDDDDDDDFELDDALSDFLGNEDELEELDDQLLDFEEDFRQLMRAHKYDLDSYLSGHRDSPDEPDKVKKKMKISKSAPDITDERFFELYKNGGGNPARRVPAEDNTSMGLSLNENTLGDAQLSGRMIQFVPLLLTTLAAMYKKGHIHCDCGKLDGIISISDGAVRIDCKRCGCHRDIKCEDNDDLEYINSMSALYLDAPDD